MGIVSLATAFAAYYGLTNGWVVMVAWLLVGFLEVLYYPSRDCLYRALAGTNDAARADANRSAATIYHIGRALISVAMMGIVLALSPVPDEVPRCAIAVALLLDAISFAIVVVFLCTLKGVQGTEREDVGAQTNVA